MSADRLHSLTHGKVFAIVISPSVISKVKGAMLPRKLFLIPSGIPSPTSFVGLIHLGPASLFEIWLLDERVGRSAV